MVFTNATILHTFPSVTPSHHELSQYINCKTFEWIYLSWESNEGVFSGMPEQQNTAPFTLYPSCYCCLFPFVIYCCRLLLNCTVLPALISGLQIDSGGGGGGEEAIFYIISSPSGSRESLIQTGLFSMPLTLLWPSLAQSFVLLSFLDFFFLFLLSSSAHLLFSSFSSNFYSLRNAACRKIIIFVENIIHCNVIFNSLAVLF